jgi:glutamate-ammonia-ligase adenylyltransferase
VYWSDNIRQLESLQVAGILPAETAEMLADAYRTLRDRIHELSLQEQEAVVDAGQFVREREAVRAAWVRLVEQKSPPS